MTKKTQTPQKRTSRRQRYRSQQRNSWLSFLGKLTLFFVPVTIATVWLVWLLIGFGTELPILVLEFGKRGASDPTESKRAGVWTCETYGRASEEGGIKLPETIVYGGPNKDVLVIFNDLLATARKTADKIAPCVFIPAKSEEHQTYGMVGLISEPTQRLEEQWRPFEDYLLDILEQLAQQTPNHRDTKKLLLAFDIDHPDLPGRLPPQANPFIGLCQSQWESIRVNLEKTYPQFDVYVWLSHGPGQKSYWDSNPTYVESFFKHRFERGLTGDVCIEIPPQQRSNRDVNYSHLKQYVKKRVTSDASLHYLIQEPVFLEPQNMSDFPLLRFKTSLQENVVGKPGKLFSYRNREKIPEMDSLWAKFQQIKHEYKWEIDNPLAIQQANMLLLQMERLWYEGKGTTALFAELGEQVETFLETHHTIQPVQHSLSDAFANAQRTNVDFVEPLKFPADWLLKLPGYESLPEGDERSALEAKSDSRVKAIRRWQADYPDWRGAHLVWQSLIAPQGGVLNHDMIRQGLELLNEDQILVNKSQVPFDEVLFLRRLVDELVWPEIDHSAHTRFERLVRSALNTRQNANRFAAMLPPILTDQYKEEFEELEKKRRSLEDRLFAHDQLFAAGNSLSLQYSELLEDYDGLLKSSKMFARHFASAQAKLLLSAHDFRYRLESLASAGNEIENTNWIKNYFDKIGELSQTKIEAFKTSDPATDLFEKSELDQTIFSDVAKGRATLPEQDLAAFSDNKPNLGAADGNLLGRRLVFWPGLALKVRKDLHQELSDKSDKYVTLDEEGEIFKGGLAASITEASQRLPAMQTATDSADLLSVGEQFLMEVAVKSNRLSPYLAYSTNGQKLAELINGFHARKSDLDFRRTALDLCGTNVGGGRSFVQSSLEMHQQLIERRLNELTNRQVTPELNSVRAAIADVWRATYDKADALTWRQRAKQVDEFSSEFLNWEWDRIKQQAISVSLDSPMDAQYKAGNQGMLLSISPVGATFGNIAGTEVDRSDSTQVALSTQKLAEANVRLKLYLRGHHFELDSQSASEIKTEYLAVKHTNRPIHGAKIRVQRATEDPVIGQVKILIDCSLSMGNGENSLMERSKSYVKGFLESAAARSDIEVALYAFGGSVLHDNDGNESINSAALSSWVLINAKDDVWKYQGNGKRLDTSTQKGFTSAVDQLHAFGETPIVAALDLALAKVVDKPQLLVLLTDGFEFTKAKGQLKPRAFNAAGRFVKVQNLLGKPQTDLVIFNMSSVDVANQNVNNLTPAKQQRLRKQFAGTISPNFTLGEIVERIARINSLSNYRETGNGGNLNQLKEFFAGVLPRPVVERTPAFENSQDADEPSKGNMIREVNLAPDDQPKSWHLGMQFRTKSENIKTFNKKELQWSTDQQTYGNELLDFIYNPFLNTFELVTAWERKESSKNFLVGSQQLLIHSDPTRIDKPSFLVASSDSQLLTPSPAMVWVALSQAAQDRQMLLQDYNLISQTRSNVHPIEFPEVEDVWRNEAIFKAGTPIDMTFHWLDRFPADYWSKLNLANINDKLLTNENGVEVKLEEKTVSLSKLFQMNAAPFKGHNFQLEYENLGESFKLTTRISFTQEADGRKAKGLDRWMVQILSPDGTKLHRSCRLKSKRRYRLENQEAGGQKLVAIDHELTIDRKMLKKSGGGYLGFANLDEIESGTAKISKVPFPKYHQ